MSGKRAKKLRKELLRVMKDEFGNAEISRNLWRNYKRNYVRNKASIYG